MASAGADGMGAGPWPGSERMLAEAQQPTAAHQPAGPRDSRAPSVPSRVSRPDDLARAGSPAERPAAERGGRASVAEAEADASARA